MWQRSGLWRDSSAILLGEVSNKETQVGLLPMTESMYVAGTLESVDTVLLEIGTGYYVEVSYFISN